MWKRPGNIWASVAISIAVYATLRTTAGAIPMPTLICVVAANAAVAWVNPPWNVRSSTIHNSSREADSTWRAKLGEPIGRPLPAEHHTEGGHGAATDVVEPGVRAS